MSGAKARMIVILAVAAGLLVVAGANAHLLYVAVTSQPDCVPHLKQGEGQNGGQNGTFRAAKSACTPGARS